MRARSDSKIAPNALNHLLTIVVQNYIRCNRADLVVISPKCACKIVSARENPERVKRDEDER